MAKAMLGLSAAPALRLPDPDALVGAPVVDRKGEPVGTVAGVVTASRRRVASILVRGSDGATFAVDESRVLGFDAGRVLVRSR